jgi:transglutaminase-like putative cysteine protease
MMPLGIVVISAVSFTYIGMRFVHIFLGITLLALVRANVKRMEVFWARLGMDFSPELRRDATVAGTALASLVLVAALLMPYLTYWRAVFGFWDLVGPKVTGFYKELDKAFAGRSPVPEPTRGYQGLGGHNVASGGLVGEDSVFIVTVSDPAPPVEEEMAVYESIGIDPMTLYTKRYWRERTYDVYTGHGWDTSSRNPSQVQAEQAWIETSFPYEVVTQTYRLLDARANFGFAVNEMVSVDQSYRTISRGEGDLAAYSIDAAEYTVVSHAPIPTAGELIAAEEAYPDWVAERYLGLPPIPTRVSELAEELVQTTGATTRYDKARVIEAYIRNFIYDLDIEPPPLDADIVDYFLFEAQRGYCDYSATAMVVMLRSLGVAARYASGFGQGTYDVVNEGWVVNEGNAHAWVEVYFPDYGWIEFEPTPIHRVFTRIGGSSSALGPLAPLAPAAGEAQTARSLPMWAWILILVGVVTFVVVWPPRYLAKRLAPRQMIWRTYDRVTRWARWLGLAPLDGQTPREFLSWLAYHVEKRTGGSGEAARELAIISQLYLRARYAINELEMKEGWRAEAAWRALRPKLLRAALTRERVAHVRQVSGQA